MARDTRIVNTGEMEWKTGGNGERFVFEHKRPGAAAGGRQLGCSLYRLPPGKAAFPAHLHHANEEAIYVLSGQGTLRIGDSEYPVAAGDYVALPAGPSDAHQMRNTSADPLEYLCLSTMITPEVAEYPDSDKVGVMSFGSPTDKQPQPRLLKLFKGDSGVGYYDGE